MSLGNGTLSFTDGHCPWCSKPPTKGNKAELLLDGEEAYPEMIDAIDGSRERVWLSCYQFEYDDIGGLFVERLKEAGKRGVDIRIILDSWGEFACQDSAGKPLRAAGLKVRAFHPLWRANKIFERYHRKFLLVDGRVSFTGGMNIRDRHLTASFEGNRMRDTVIKLQGPISPDLDRVFLSDWLYCGGSKQDLSPLESTENGDVTIRVFGCGMPLCRLGLRRAILDKIRSSRERIAIVSPFFSLTVNWKRPFPQLLGGASTYPFSYLPVTSGFSDGVLVVISAYWLRPAARFC